MAGVVVDSSLVYDLVGPSAPGGRSTRHVIPATFVACMLAACGSDDTSSVDDGGRDAGPEPDAAPDASPDEDGGADAAADTGAERCDASGWTIEEAWEGRIDHPRIAFDDSGRLHAVYLGDLSGLGYAWRDGSGAWTTEASGATGEPPEMAVDAMGRVHVVTGGMLGSDVHYHRRDADGTWSSSVVRSSIDVTGVSVSFALDSSGAPHLVFVDGTDSTLYHVTPAESSGWPADESGWTAEEVDANPSSHPSNADVAIRSGDGGIICWQHDNRISCATNAGGASWNDTREELYDATYVGYHPRIALDTDDGAHVTFPIGEPSADDIIYRIAYARPSGSYEEVDSAPGQTGSLGSLVAVSSAGVVHLVYHFHLGDERALRHASKEPGGSWTVQTIDCAEESPGSQRYDLALDPDGVPWVAFVRPGADTALLAHP